MSGNLDFAVGPPPGVNAGGIKTQIDILGFKPTYFSYQKETPAFMPGSFTGGGHIQQIEGESPLLSLMEAKS